MALSANRVQVAVVFGTRPEAVKLAPVIAELRRRPEQFHVSLVVTGQHREMLDQFLRFFQLTPDLDLDLMQTGQSVSRLTANAVRDLEPVYQKLRPDLVLVQGDTASVFAAALAAFYQQIAVGHVEAGLRSYHKWEPFPEEMLRQMTSVITDLHFAPTGTARANLRREGIPEDRIFVVGNTVVDALKSVVEDVEAPPALKERMVLVTAHRRENLGKPLEAICHALLEILQSHRDLRVVYPVHKNPQVREVVFPLLSGHERIELLEPSDYLEFLQLMRQSYLILSDSGGVQEEAPFFGKPVLVLRRTTERPEGIAQGVAALVGTDQNAIVSAARRLLDDPDHYATMSRGGNPYGDGLASARIVQAILYHRGLISDPPEEFVAASVAHGTSSRTA